MKLRWTVKLKTLRHKVRGEMQCKSFYYLNKKRARKLGVIFNGQYFAMVFPGCPRVDLSLVIKSCGSLHSHSLVMEWANLPRCVALRFLKQSLFMVQTSLNNVSLVGSNYSFLATVIKRREFILE